MHPGSLLPAVVVAGFSGRCWWLVVPGCLPDFAGSECQTVAAGWVTSGYCPDKVS